MGGAVSKRGSTHELGNSIQSVHASKLHPPPVGRDSIHPGIAKPTGPVHVNVSQTHFLQEPESDSRHLRLKESDQRRRKPHPNEASETLDQYEKDLPPGARTRSHQGIVPAVFRWEEGGKEAYVAGTFNNWEWAPMHRSGHDFTYIQSLPKGKHAYKFIVDGDWRCATDQPVEPDANGNVNNVLDLSEFHSDSARSPRGRFDSDPELLYSTNVPDEDIYTKDPPTLPSHLRQIVLNTDAKTTAAGHKELPVPSHVAIDHLFCSAIRDGIMVQGTTQRYRDKTITTVYYSILPVNASVPTPDVSVTSIPPAITSATGAEKPETSMPSAATYNTPQSTSLSEAATAQSVAASSPSSDSTNAAHTQLQRLVAAMTSEEQYYLQQQHAQIEAQLQHQQALLQHELQSGRMSHEQASSLLSQAHAQAQDLLTQVQRRVLAHVQARLDQHEAAVSTPRSISATSETQSNERRPPVAPAQHSTTPQHSEQSSTYSHTVGMGPVNVPTPSQVASSIAAANSSSARFDTTSSNSRQRGESQSSESIVTDHIARSQAAAKQVQAYAANAAAKLSEAHRRMQDSGD